MSKGKAKKGSQRDIQLFFNDKSKQLILQHLLTKQINTQIAKWLSPIAKDNYLEYQDDGFMRTIGLESETTRLVGGFWPKGGPVWDGLARAEDGSILLFEAKAHISELFGGGMKASSAMSRNKIFKSLAMTAEYIGAAYNPVLWTDEMYQTANRLAHLYFLNKELHVKARLIYLIFLNDKTVAPHNETEEKWRTAIDVAERYILKLPSRKKEFSDGTNGSWRDWVKHVFINMEKLDDTII